MKVLAPAFYELDPDESFTIRIECVGGAYLAAGNVNNFKLRFTPDSPEADVTPAILAGPDSVNIVHLHLTYQKDVPAESYRVTVLNQEGEVVETINSGLDPGRTLAYRVDIDLVVEVQ